MLVGTPDEVFESVPARNLADGHTRFEIDPRDHISAIRQARTRTLDVVGFYHSHPASRAYPSETDVAECGYAGALHIIVGVSASGPEARLFAIDGSHVAELNITVVHPEGG